MKHGKKPTRTQRKILEKWHKNPGDWLVVKDTPELLVCVYRYSDNRLINIPKGVK